MTAALLDALRTEVGNTGQPVRARHPVTTTAIADWCDAMGETNPNYGTVAPPAMLDVWDRAGLIASRGGDDPRGRVIAALEAHGFVSVVAVGSELEIGRYLRPGELVGNRQVLEDVSAEKHTALGVGHFVTSRHDYTTADGEHVGSLRFRILKFKPGTGRTPPTPASRPTDPDPARRPKPAVNSDNQFFWDGAREHQLRVQRCDACGTCLNPPSPRCPACGSYERGFAVASGRATLYSFAVVHHPQVDGFRYPLPVGLVELDDGVGNARMLADLVGAPPESLRVGMPLELDWLDGTGSLPLPRFRPAVPTPRGTTATATELSPGGDLGLWAVPVTPTLIVSGALATRDFQAVHHDRDLALRRGSPDIFMNINTSVGLMQRFVTDALGPDVVVRALRVRLGAPAYPYDTLAFTGRVESVDPATGSVSLMVRGRCGLGDHVVGSVELEVKP